MTRPKLENSEKKEIDAKLLTPATKKETDTEFLTPALEIKDLSVRYGSHLALNKVNLKIYPREYIGIIGPNGGGKTTLLKSILGLAEISSGQIEIMGEAAKKGRTRIGYVPQNVEFDRSFPISVLEVVLTGMLRKGMRPLKRYTKEEVDRAKALLDSVGIGDMHGNHISAMSGGQFQKMLIARALATNPDILLLDEPTASVDSTSRAQIYDLLNKLNERITIVLVTHDLLAISSMVDKLACLNEVLIFHGDPELNDETVSAMYGCPVDLIAHGVPHRVLKEHNHRH